MSESSGFSGSARGSTVSARDASSAELVTRLTQQSTELIRNELRLAQAEMTVKAKHAGMGAGLFGAPASWRSAGSAP